jgi:hypothetical protein
LAEGYINIACICKAIAQFTAQFFFADQAKCFGGCSLIADDVKPNTQIRHGVEERLPSKSGNLCYCARLWFVLFRDRDHFFSSLLAENA